MENVRFNYPYIAICSSRRSRMSTGWSVHKFTKKGLQLDKTNRAKTYHGVSTDFNKAMSNVRKWYGIRLPVGEWSEKKQYKYRPKTPYEVFLTGIFLALFKKH